MTFEKFRSMVYEKHINPFLSSIPGNMPGISVLLYSYNPKLFRICCTSCYQHIILNGSDNLAEIESFLKFLDSLWYVQRVKSK